MAVIPPKIRCGRELSGKGQSGVLTDNALLAKGIESTISFKGVEGVVPNTKLYIGGKSGAVVTVTSVSRQQGGYTAKVLAKDMEEGKMVQYTEGSAVIKVDIQKDICGEGTMSEHGIFVNPLFAKKVVHNDTIFVSHGNAGLKGVVESVDRSTGRMVVNFPDTPVLTDGKASMYIMQR
jgi:hypothetical protein